MLKRCLYKILVMARHNLKHGDLKHSGNVLWHPEHRDAYLIDTELRPAGKNPLETFNDALEAKGFKDIPKSADNPKPIAENSIVENFPEILTSSR